MWYAIEAPPHAIVAPEANIYGFPKTLLIAFRSRPKIQVYRLLWWATVSLLAENHAPLMHRSIILIFTDIFTKLVKMPQIWFCSRWKMRREYWPTTVRFTKKLRVGWVPIWHSYKPESRSWADRSCSVHSLVWRWWKTEKRPSLVYMCRPIVRMCRSRCRIHETYNRMKIMINYWVRSHEGVRVPINMDWWEDAWFIELWTNQLERFRNLLSDDLRFEFQ